jgi:hypothetical protein
MQMKLKLPVPLQCHQYFCNNKLLIGQPGVEFMKGIMRYAEALSEACFVYLCLVIDFKNGKVPVPITVAAWSDA